MLLLPDVSLLCYYAYCLLAFSRVARLFLIIRQRHAPFRLMPCRCRLLRFCRAPRRFCLLMLIFALQRLFAADAAACC